MRRQFQMPVFRVVMLPFMAVMLLVLVLLIILFQLMMILMQMPLVRAVMLLFLAVMLPFLVVMLLILVRPVFLILRPLQGSTLRMILLLKVTNLVEMIVVILLLQIILLFQPLLVLLLLLPFLVLTPRTASVTQLPYARLYRQYLDDDTIVGGDGTTADTSIAGSDTSASLPRAGDETLDNVTATPALGDATASATSPQVAKSVVSGARSWFGVALMTFALIAVLALLLSSAYYSAHASISDQGSLVSWGLDHAVDCVRAYVRQHVRRRVHSGLNLVLSWLSPRVIRWLPTGIIPPEQISRLPLDYITSLPIEYLAEQPVEIIARLPPELISHLPTPVISELHVSSIWQLHLRPTRWLSVGVHAWQRLLSTVYHIQLFPTFLLGLLLHLQRGYYDFLFASLLS